uniref:hypothetical protein n=1 Tax=Leptospira noguchii TaxID=28182 RepID=UPI001F3619DB
LVSLPLYYPFLQSFFIRLFGYFFLVIYYAIVSKSGYTRIEPSSYLNYYWNWWLGGGGGNYAYYPKFNDASNNLQIHIIDEEECIRDGSRIVFKDYDENTLDYYYLTVWDGGNWDGYLYLWNKTYNLRETFRVRLNTQPERNWKNDLIYR